MKNKRKKKKLIKKTDLILVVILILIIALIGILFSYARFHVDAINNATTTTIKGTFECLDVNYNQDGVLSLNKNYPVSDAYALENFTPINVTITNNCSSETTPVDYALSLSTIYQKLKNYADDYISADKIRMKVLKTVGAEAEETIFDVNYLNKSKKFGESNSIYNFVSEHHQNDATYVNHNLKDVYKVDSGSLSSNQTINYKIYLWIDYYEGAPGRVENPDYNSSTQNKLFETSIAVTLNAVENVSLANILASSNELWSSGLEGDGLRYVGTDSYTSSTTPSNFICFGTSNKDECKADESKYMYRIIGVFPDENESQHLKLIKLKRAGNTKWHSTASSDINWGENSFYTELNGTRFLENTTYDYLQDNNWLNKIENWKWTAVNTLTASGGPNYTNISPANVYLHEMNRSTKTSTVGEWTYPTGKIGLMYLSDYVLSLGQDALNLTSCSNGTTLKTSWLFHTNNDSSGGNYQFVMSRYGMSSSTNKIWDITSNGSVTNYSCADSDGGFPVFYLINEVYSSEGDGTYANPYIIE